MIRMDCKTTWKCLNCNTNLPNEQIQLILRDIRLQVQQIGPNIEHIELFISKYTRMLHPNHYLLIEMKQKLAAVIRHTTTYDNATNLNGTVARFQTDNAANNNNTDQRILSPLENLLQRKIDLCKEFIPLLSILQPGISRLKAIALYEQFSPLVQLARLHHQHKIISDAEYLVNIILYHPLLFIYHNAVTSFAYMSCNDMMLMPMLRTRCCVCLNVIQ